MGAIFDKYVDVHGRIISSPFFAPTLFYNGALLWKHSYAEEEKMVKNVSEQAEIGQIEFLGQKKEEKDLQCEFSTRFLERLERIGFLWG